MTDNKLLNYSFTVAGKNKYYASEVDEYLRSISENYDTMYKNYMNLDKKMKTLAPAIEEYKSNKNIIVSAIVRAEKYADDLKNEANETSAEIIKKASEEVENYVMTKKAEADAYYYNLTHEADDRLKALEAEIEVTEKHADELREKYLAKINERAAEIIDNAKTKAAEIVAAAYQDAKEARQQSEDIIMSTNAELNRLKAEIAKYKNEIFNVVATIKPAVDSITADAYFEFAPTEVDVDVNDFAQEIPEFSLDMVIDEVAAATDPVPAPVQDDVYEDISSFTNPYNNSFGASEYTEDVKAVKFDDEVYDEVNSAVFTDFKSAIFADNDSDDSPVDFSYHTDFDSLFEENN